ncbi:MAG: PIN domain-containing protein [Bacteroidales bacterium]|nr:PIN domain-containing protein [Bacteroidales bacterium]
MKLFLDTNVILDYLCKREPFCKDADIMFEMFERGIHKGMVTSLTIVNCAYILRKVLSKHQIAEIVDWLCHDFIVTAIDRITVVKANNKNAKDFEDAVQYFSALPSQPDVIITRDKQGFKGLGPLVITPAEFVAESRK